MKGILSLLKSRKAWITLIGVIASVAGFEAGLSQEQVYLIAGLCAILVISIMGEDIAKYLKVNLPEEQKNASKEALIKEVIKEFTKPKD